MTETEEKRLELAAAAGKEQMREYLYDTSSRVLKAVLQNRNITEQDVLIIASRKNIAGEILEIIAKDNRWAESYPIRLVLARNPRSPLFVSLSMARFLRVFDLEEITRSHYVPVVMRHKVEAMLVERIPTMPLGNKKALAKKAAGNVLLKLLQDRLTDVVKLCLDNPHLSEAHLYKVINRIDTIAETILMIAEHAVWSSRPLIRFALTRNAHTPLSVSVRFLKTMKLVDLRELYNDPSLPVTVKPLVYRELSSRGVDPGKAGEQTVYEVEEGEADDLDAVMKTDEYREPDEDNAAEERQ